MIKRFLKQLALRFLPDRSQGVLIHPLLVVSVIGSFYILTMPTAFITGDSAAELGAAMSWSGNWNPSHLLTTPFYSILIKIVHLVFGQGGEFIFLQLINILMGLCGALLLYKSLTLLGCDDRLSAILTLMFGLCNGMWIHATTAETGVHPQFFLMISFYVLIRFLVEKADYSFMIVSFLALSISVLFALYMVVFLIPWFLVLFLTCYAKGDRRRLLRLLLVGLTTTGITLAIPYLLAAFSEHKHTITSMISWLTSHSESGRLSHLNPLSVEGLTRPVAGFMSLFVAPHSSLTIVKLALRGEASQGIDVFSYCRLALSLSVFFCVGGYILVGLRGIRKSISRLFFVTCLVFLFAFNVMWLGSDPQFWLPGLPMILAMIGLGITQISTGPRMAGALRGVLVLLSVLFVSFNVPREIPSILFPAGGKSLGIASDFASGTTNRCVIVSPGWSWVDYTRAGYSHIGMVDLVYNDNLGSGAEFYLKIDSLISHSLESGTDIYFDGLNGEKHIEQYGAWQMFGSTRETTREDLRDYLAAKYHVEGLSGEYDGELLSVGNARVDIDSH